MAATKQSRQAKSLLAKVRFIEWLSTMPELTRTDLAVAIRIVSAYNERCGYAFPSMERIADDTGMTKRTVIRAVGRLEKAGIINVWHSTGRSNANEYKPHFERVPEGDVYQAIKGDRCDTLSSTGDETERVTFRAKRVTPEARKSDTHVTPTELVTGFKGNRSPAGAFTGVNADSFQDLNRKDAAMCRKAEEAIKADNMTAQELKEFEDQLWEIVENREVGNDIQGWAQRLYESLPYVYPD